MKFLSLVRGSGNNCFHRGDRASIDGVLVNIHIGLNEDY